MANWNFLLFYFIMSVMKIAVSSPLDYYHYYYDYYDYYDNYTTNHSSGYLKFPEDYKDVVRRNLPRVFNICPEVRMTDTLESPPSNVTYPAFNGTSCCKPCSVAQDCHVTHSYNFCCPQAEMALSDIYSESSAFCVSAVVYNYIDFSGLSEYMMVDNCRIKQEYPENAFDDVVLVHSNGILYKNKHTAECNGVTEYTRWQLLATGCDFPAILQRTRRDELFQSVQKNCIVYSAPPEGFDASHFMCYRFSIDVCNATGLWDKYDVEIDFLCDTFNSGAHDSEGRAYHNVFCLACNQPTTYLDTPPTCESPWSHRPPLNEGIYTILPDNYLQNDTESSCGTLDILDIYMNQCRPLLCPSRQLPYNGKCLDTKVETSVFQIIFRLSPSGWRRTMYISITTENHEANNARLLSYFGLLQVCKVQSNYLYAYETAEGGTDADFVIYDLRLNISNTCNESFVSQKLKKSIDNFPLQVGETSVNVTVQMTIPFQYDPLIHALKPMATFKDNTCGTCLIRMLIPLECPYIKLELIEICYLYQKNHLTDSKTSCSDITTKDWFKENVSIGDDVVDGAWSRVLYMCVHKYNNMFTEESSNDKNKVVSSSPKSQSARLNVYNALYFCAACLVLFLQLNA